jgi:hypothetical protein
MHSDFLIDIHQTKHNQTHPSEVLDSVNCRSRHSTDALALLAIKNASQSSAAAARAEQRVALLMMPLAALVGTLALLAGRASAATVAVPLPAYAVGDAVLLHGLVSGKEHNGAAGVITGPLVSGRHAVTLAESRAVRRVRPHTMLSASATEPGRAGAGLHASRAAENVAIALLLPDAESHTRLVLQPEAVQWLEALSGPVALVSVVGAYRTGKSFLLNELMGAQLRATRPIAHHWARTRCGAHSR